MPHYRLNVDEPLWDQSTFVGRFRHFLWMTDMRTCVESEENLDNAKILIEQYRKGMEPPGTTTEQIIYAKKLYESSFHPDSGEKQNVFGRMSFQVPGGMLITGAMLQFYRYILFRFVFYLYLSGSVFHLYSSKVVFYLYPSKVAFYSCSSEVVFYLYSSKVVFYSYSSKVVFHLYLSKVLSSFLFVTSFCIVFVL